MQGLIDGNCKVELEKLPPDYKYHINYPELYLNAQYNDLYLLVSESNPQLLTRWKIKEGKLYYDWTYSLADMIKELPIRVQETYCKNRFTFSSLYPISSNNEHILVSSDEYMLE